MNNISTDQKATKSIDAVGTGIEHKMIEQPSLAVPSRRSFLSKSAFALAGTATLAMFKDTHAFAASKEEEREVGNRASQKANFKAIRGHENDHVQFLLMALGSAARPKPTFKGLLQKTYTDFCIIAQALENTGVGAYLGAAPFINDPLYLSAAGSILTVESRHSGYLNTYLHDPITAPASDDDANPSFDAPLTAAQVVAGAGVFIASLNGGPDVTYAQTRSDANDIDILNFAMALEFLEADFYQLNYAKFYGR